MTHRRSRAARLQKLRRFEKRGLAASAIRLARRHLIEYPDDGVVWHLLGGQLIELARYEEAEQAMAMAIEHCPPEKLWIPLGQMGLLFQYLGDCERAEEWFRKGIDADPDEATCYMYLGAMFAKQGRFVDAEELHRSAIRSRRGCIDEAYLNLGFVLRARERFREAADCFRETIRLDPNDRDALRALRDVEYCLRLDETN